MLPLGAGPLGSDELRDCPAGNLRASSNNHLHNAVLKRMNWKYVSYSASTGVAVTALFYVFYREGRQLVLWPGIFMDVMVNGDAVSYPIR